MSDRTPNSDAPPGPPDPDKRAAWDDGAGRRRGDDRSMYVIKRDLEEEKAARTANGQPRRPLLPEGVSRDNYVVTASNADADSDESNTTPAARAKAAPTPTRPIPTTSPRAAAPTRGSGSSGPTYVLTPDPSDPSDALDSSDSLDSLVDSDTPTEPTPHVTFGAPTAPPKKRGNRTFGALVAVLASIVFSVLFAFGVLIVFRMTTGVATMGVLANPGYWVPPVFFLVGTLVLALVANRAGWWAHIVGSLAVAVLVYLGSSVIIGLYQAWASGAPVAAAAVLGSPTTIIAAVLAREVSLWAGGLVARRGRAVAARNAEERAAFEGNGAAALGG